MRFTKGADIKKFRKEHSLSQERFAQLVKITSKTLGSWEDMDPLRPRDAALLNEIFKNGLPEIVSRETLEVREDSGAYGPSFDDFVHIPEVSITAGAGPGFEVLQERIVCHLALRASYLRSRGISARNVIAFDVEGESMQGVVDDGDKGFANLANTRITAQRAVYLFRNDGAIQIKWLTLASDGRHIVVESANPDKKIYPAYQIDLKKPDDFAVIGHVFTQSGKLPDNK